MNTNTKAKRLIAILLILCISIGLGIFIDRAWTFIERALHPTDYADIISAASIEFDVPKYIIYATIKVESDFDPYAESSRGAMGLMQMIPSTFEWLTGDEHLSEHLEAKLLFEPEVSIRYGVYYLKYLYSKFDHKWDVACAAYNGGEGNVANWLTDERYSDGEGNLTSFPDNFDETKNYVKKIKKAREMYRELY